MPTVEIDDRPGAASTAADGAKDPFLMMNLENLRDVLFVEDMNFNLIYISPSVSSLFGYTVEEIRRLEKKDFMTPESFARAMERFEDLSALAQGAGELELPLMEYEYVRKDGSTFWGELQVTFLRDSAGRLIGSQGILRDIDERKKMEEILRQSEMKSRTLFDLSPQAIFLARMPTGELMDVNEKFCRMAQSDRLELMGKLMAELGFYSHEDLKKFWGELRESGEVQDLELEFKSRDGSILNTQVFARLIDLQDGPHALTVLYDRTREKRLEHQFLQAQKMESVGTLAGGIAHDFNNLLMGIQGNVSLMLVDMEVSHPHHEMVCEIGRHVRSCSELTRQLLGYARKGKYEVVPLDLNSLIEETSLSFQRARKQIRVMSDLNPGLLPVEGDAVQIRQLLYNLYVNAADAMPNGGDLFLKTANVSFADMAGRTYKPKKNDYVSITASDTGTGMDQETLSHLFEPFFTTKEMGKGTGLGMASVYGIVKGHGGYIDVESEPGKGATFSIYLPASQRKLTAPVQPSGELLRTDGAVMIVDDDKDVLESASRLLNRMGFTVYKAENGPQALEIYKEQGQRIDLVILDMTMPGMDGGEVCDRIREIRPDAKVVLSSGYGRDGRVAEVLERGCSGFIQKPYSIKDLSLKIGGILKGGPAH